MNSDIKMARRYHWISEKAVCSFVSEPHSGIICNKAHRSVLDITASESTEVQKTSLDLLRGSPQNLVSSIMKLNLGRNPTLDDWISSNEENASKFKLTDSFEMPKHLNWKIINKAYEIQPKNYEEFVSIEWVGLSLIRALALLSQLIYGTSASWKDPVRYSFAHGGKDGVPYPVDRITFDRSIRFLRDAIEGGEISREEKRTALKKLSTNLKIILPSYVE